tara:strand:- start:3375 stop:3764 length:390 start_codon:yes stop_codon:yes gene_type:complete
MTRVILQENVDQIMLSIWRNHFELTISPQFVPVTQNEKVLTCLIVPKNLASRTKDGELLSKTILCEDDTKVGWLLQSFFTDEIASCTRVLRVSLPKESSVDPMVFSRSLMASLKYHGERDIRSIKMGVK